MSQGDSRCAPVSYPWRWRRLYAPQTWCAASQSCGLVNLPPTNAIRQQPQAVVGEVAKAVADALDLLDQQVHGLGGPARAAIGGMPGKDLGLPGPHGAGKARQLRHPDAVSPALEAAPAGARNVATNTVDPSAAVHHGGLVTGDREDGERGPARTCSRQQRPQLIPPGRRVCGWSGTIVRRREGRRFGPLGPCRVHHPVGGQGPPMSRLTEVGPLLIAERKGVVLSSCSRTRTRRRPHRRRWDRCRTPGRAGLVAWLSRAPGR